MNRLRNVPHNATSWVYHLQLLPCKSATVLDGFKTNAKHLQLVFCRNQDLHKAFNPGQYCFPELLWLQYDHKLYRGRSNVYAFVLHVVIRCLLCLQLPADIPSMSLESQPSNLNPKTETLPPQPHFFQSSIPCKSRSCSWSRSCIRELTPNTDQHVARKQHLPQLSQSHPSVETERSKHLQALEMWLRGCIISGSNAAVSDPASTEANTEANKALKAGAQTQGPMLGLLWALREAAFS